MSETIYKKPNNGKKARANRISHSMSNIAKGMSDLYQNSDLTSGQAKAAFGQRNTQKIRFNIS